MQSMPTLKDSIAARWVNDDVRDLFYAEISNERDGGVSPSTLSSAIDSISQGLPFHEDTDVENLLIHLLMIRDLLPGTTHLEDLLVESKRVT